MIKSRIRRENRRSRFYKRENDKEKVKNYVYKCERGAE